MLNHCEECVSCASIFECGSRGSNRGRTLSREFALRVCFELISTLIGMHPVEEV